MVTSLTNGVEYTFRVRALNTLGGGDPSGEVRATPVAAEPPARPVVSATPGDGVVALSWERIPGADKAQYRYKFHHAANYGGWVDLTTGQLSARSLTVPGLTNDRIYRFEVRAGNSYGWGEVSYDVTSRPSGSPPKPYGFRATPGDGQITLSWFAISTATGWEYRQTTGSFTDNWTSITPSDGSTTSHTVASLTNGTEYKFQVRAENANGPGAESNEMQATPAVTDRRPAKTTGLAAMAGKGQVTLRWSPQPAVAVIGWQYQYKGPGQYYAGWHWVSGSSRATTSHVVTGLTPGTEYRFRVRVESRAGFGDPSDEATATPLAAKPPKPTGVSAAAGDGQVTLSWNSMDGVTGWQYRQRDAGDWRGVPGGAGTLTVTVDGLINDNEYTLKVRAGNARGYGDSGYGVKATPVAASP